MNVERARHEQLRVAEAVWVRGEAIATVQRNAISETKALLARGASVFFLKPGRDVDGMARLKQLLWRKDLHVILGWLLPKEINALRPILQDRGNFSLLTDDWWIYPNWIMAQADYILFRKFHGIAVRLGWSRFPCASGDCNTRDMKRSRGRLRSSCATTQGERDGLQIPTPSRKCSWSGGMKMRSS